MSARDAYPAGHARALLDTDAVTAPTRDALRARLAPPPAGARYLTHSEFATLAAACARLLPRPGVEIAPEIDARLAAGICDGWRYDALPSDGEAYRRGMAGLDQTARATFGAPFAQLAPAGQDTVLLAVQGGTAPGEAWQAMPAERFFEELLAEAAEVFFAHPLAQEAIGYAGMADAPGWTRIGLDEREDREPAALRG